MKVGVVLGAGGIIGGAWLAGALKALEAATRWDPGSADRLVGTSAGSVMAALLAGGAPPWREGTDTAAGEPEDLAAAGSPFGDEATEERMAAAEAGEGDDDPGGMGLRLHTERPRLGPASPKLALSALRQRDHHSPAAFVAGLLPEGVFSLDELQSLIRGVVPAGWADHPGLWIVACAYSTGERTVFGRADAPAADLADAVAASCAIPAFYRAIRIGGHRYVDGGLWSPSNLDVLEGEGLDLVICLNPTSSLAPSGSRVSDRVAGLWRSASGRALGSEAKRLRAAGTEVVLVQPTAEDLEVMPANLMSRRRRREVYETARRTVGEQLRSGANREAVEALWRRGFRAAAAPAPPRSA